MNRYGERLQELKKLLMTGDDFNATYRFFFDNFSDRAFFGLGRKAKNPIIKATLESVRGQMFGEEGKVSLLKLINIPSARFYHGGCTINGRMATVIYFEDIEMGMVAIAMSLTSGQMHYARFSTTRVPADKAGAMVGPGTRTLQ